MRVFLVIHQFFLLQSFLMVPMSLFVFGCGENPAVQAVEALSREVCACSDLECVKQAEARWTPKLKEMEKTARGSRSDQKAIEAAGRRMQECRERMANGPANPAP